MNDYSGAGYNQGTQISDMDVVTREAPQTQEQNSERVASTKKATIKTHTYPLNIHAVATNDKEKPAICEIIQFTAFKKGGLSFGRVSEESKKQAQAEARQVNVSKVKPSAGAGSVKATTEKTTAQIAQDEADKEARAKKQAEDDERTLWEVAAKAIAEQLKKIRATQETLEHCFLYMPASVTYSEGASWAAEELGAVGNMISQGLRAKGGGIKDLLSNFGAGAAGNLAKAATVGISAAAAGVSGILGAGAMLGGLSSGLGHAGRVATNPYAEQMFSGVDFRTFTFEFTFVATNLEEYREVKNIIKMFRFHSRPSYAIGGSDGIYSYPNEFGIYFKTMKNGKYINNVHLPRLHQCVCTKVDTNFTPDSQWLAHPDGEPISISLSLGFTETKKNTQQEIEGRY